VLPELDDMMKTAREVHSAWCRARSRLPATATSAICRSASAPSRTSQSRDSYIITLDDITDLVSAQRTSAWGDVARRIAHEIKNR